MAIESAVAKMTELAKFDYELPRELIAQHPLPNRSDARLLIVERATGTISHRHVRDLPELLQAGDCLVLNDTQVVPARLIGVRTETGGRWEGLYLGTQDERLWHLICKSRGRLKPGESITLEDRHGRASHRLRLAAKLDDGSWIADPDSKEPALTTLQQVGRVPLPQYIRHGEMEPGDEARYQTVFARLPGSVAAPTAGLHFTPNLFRRLEQAGVAHDYVTLHVGIGTFRPITAEHLEEHQMHAEWGSVEAKAVETIGAASEKGRRIIAVGTTSVRLLETASASGALEPWSGETDLFITPGYKFRTVDAMLTNFHLPKSTLLVLVRTFGGDTLLRQAYNEAIRERYRFYSYGDAMLIL